MNKNIMKALGFSKQVERFEQGKCSWCGEKIDPAMFRDDLSRKEWTISGFCQACQDETFDDERR